jgi:hypothetical protein
MTAYRVLSNLLTSNAWVITMASEKRMSGQKLQLLTA